MPPPSIVALSSASSVLTVSAPRSPPQAARPRLAARSNAVIERFMVCLLPLPSHDATSHQIHKRIRVSRQFGLERSPTRQRAACEMRGDAFYHLAHRDQRTRRAAAPRPALNPALAEMGSVFELVPTKDRRPASQDDKFGHGQACSSRPATRPIARSAAGSGAHDWLGSGGARRGDRSPTRCACRRLANGRG